jgi:Icc-related predicted phosphoesterase
MIIDCLSDLHGNLPGLEGGDLLILGGDYTAKDSSDEYIKFALWLGKQDYKKKVLIAGNHDVMVENTPEILDCPLWDYLCDSGTEFEGLKIWGSPWTKSFSGMNPLCKAFTLETDEELKEKWMLIPEDTDILVTHSPPLGHLDATVRGENVGSNSLLETIENMNPQLSISGHIHESYGKWESLRDSRTFPTIFVNPSLVNEYYEPINQPVRIIL